MRYQRSRCLPRARSTRRRRHRIRLQSLTTGWDRCIARRLRKEIFELYGYTAVVHVLSASGIRKSTRYVLRVANDGEALARQTGLLDMRGRPVRGLPAQVVGGSIDDAEAAWRGAFLAHGSL
ncbi:DNA-binding protein WhiA, partial [Mycobacterium tuberculosis]|nr:DNA-binding protein WhiA [Mycobacterium tuberculosis]